MIEIKNGVSLALLRPQILVALRVLEELYNAEGVACVITSGDDGTHKRGSKHYSGDALDIRTSTLKKGGAQRIVELARIALGASFTVILEPTHIHVQFNRTSSSSSSPSS